MRWPEYTDEQINKMLNYRKGTALQGGLVMAKSGRLEPGDKRTSLWRTLIYGQKNNRNQWKRKIRAITPFKVIQGHPGRYQSKTRMLLPISD